MSCIYCYAECHVFIVMLSVVYFIFMLSVAYFIFMLSVLYLLLCWVSWRQKVESDCQLFVDQLSREKNSISFEEKVESQFVLSSVIA
jgi:hypothetical protein